MFFDNFFEPEAVSSLLPTLSVYTGLHFYQIWLLQVLEVGIRS